jgi:hypothetical protein
MGEGARLGDILVGEIAKSSLGSCSGRYRAAMFAF